MKIKLFLSQVKKFAALLLHGKFKQIADKLQEYSYGNFLSYGLRRDLNVEVLNPQAKINIKIRELSDQDIPKLFDLNQPDLSQADRYELSVRKEYLKEKLGTCYVAVNELNEPCYFQWLISAKDNARIQTVFNRRFPWLKEDEALLENAYTPPRFRGMGIMPCAMAKIAEKGRELNARWVLTFVAHDNVPSLKGCHKAGFREYLTRTDKWFIHPRFRSLKFKEINQVSENSENFVRAAA